jgi:hypothetical protein
VDQSDAADARPPRRADRLGLRLLVMVVAILLLAAAVVLVRSRLAPELTSAQDTGKANGLSAQTARLIQLIDARRKTAGCPALTVDAELMTSAKTHVTDMAANGYASETGSDGSNPRQRAAAAGYSGQVVEIVAAGIPTPDEVFQQWTNTGNPAAAASVAKMTDCSRVHVGIGHNPGRIMPTFGPGIWVVDLGTA